MLEIGPTFEDFWEAYDKKVERKKCIRAWAKISHDDKIEIMDHVEKYVAFTPDKRYRKNPFTYLFNECYYDELIPPKQYGHFGAAEYIFDHYHT